jgi:SAM-dependent methyltransferase
MSLAQHARNKIRGFLHLYGIPSIRRFMWNKEYFGGRWACLDATTNDCVYPYIAKYVNNGSILDLGCGAGNTGNELPSATYREYWGVDISDIAVDKAIQRTHENGRADKNHYSQGDILSYEPGQRFDVILFRESIYYIPQSRVKAMLERYSHYLRKGGVFIVRLYEFTGKAKDIPDIIENNFHLVEKGVFDNPSAAVLVFRPKRAVDS